MTRAKIGKDNANYKHGMTRTRLHMVWLGMKQRCTNKKHVSYPHYGGKGIGFDSAWSTFSGFFNDMGESYRPGLTLDRIDSDKGYTKENCRWVTQHEQCYNTKRNRRLTYNGKTQTVVEWERELGFKRGIISQRLNTYKWSIEKALTTKSRTKPSVKLLALTKTSMTALQQFIEDAIKGGWDNKMQTALDWVANGMYREPLLEPPAWQAVGKTRGWVSPWRYYWIQFIDHLADGKTIDEALQAIE